MSRTIHFFTKRGREVEFEAREKGELDRTMRIPVLGQPLPHLAPIGTTCAVFRDGGQVQHTKTRSTLAILGGTPVIWLEEVSGAYAAARVRIGVDPSIEFWEGA